MTGQDLLDILAQPYDRIEKAGYGLLKENEKELLFIYDFFRNFLADPDADINDPADEDSIIEISYQSHSQSVLFDIPLAETSFDGGDLDKLAGIISMSDWISLLPQYDYKLILEISVPLLSKH